VYKKVTVVQSGTTTAVIPEEAVVMLANLGTVLVRLQNPSDVGRELKFRAEI
jgi:hypothetical protein